MVVFIRVLVNLFIKGEEFNTLIFQKILKTLSGILEEKKIFLRINFIYQ